MLSLQNLDSLNKESINCTCDRKQPVHSFRKTLTNQEGVTYLVCAEEL